MARTKAQLLIRRLKRTKWREGQRLIMGRYSANLNPDGRWYVCRDHNPIIRGRFTSIESGRSNALRGLRRLIRADHAVQL